MSSKITLALGTALAAIALCCFVESSLGQDALTVPVAESDSDDADDEPTTRMKNPAGAAHTEWQRCKHEIAAVAQRK